MQIRVANVVSLAILFIACTALLFEPFNTFAPRPLGDWVYTEVIKANPGIARRFVLVDQPY